MAGTDPLPFLDSNVVVSAFIGTQRSPPNQLLRAAAFRRIEVVISHQVLDEVARTLGGKLGWPPDASGAAIEALVGLARVVPTPRSSAPLTRSRLDDAIVGAALGAGCTHLVTGDRAVLRASLPPPLQAVTPRDFLKGWTASGATHGQ